MHKRNKQKHHTQTKSFEWKIFFDDARKMAAREIKMDAVHIGDAYYS